jgi:hypothetical protein
MLAHRHETMFHADMTPISNKIPRKGVVGLVVTGAGAVYVRISVSSTAPSPVHRRACWWYAGG